MNLEECLRRCWKSEEVVDAVLARGIPLWKWKVFAVHEGMTGAGGLGLSGVEIAEVLNLTRGICLVFALGEKCGDRSA